MKRAERMGQSIGRSQSSCCQGRARSTGRAQAWLVSAPFLGPSPAHSINSSAARL